MRELTRGFSFTSLTSFTSFISELFRMAYDQ
jgi:hypothetical protein